MSHYAPYDLRNDNDLVHVEWMGSRQRVVDTLRRMRDQGWTVTRHGLSSVNEYGNTVLAKPVSVKGDSVSTGIAIWKISNDDQEVF